jgi:phosphoribosylaminoimidazole-succinocarboxamide synthase
MSVGESPVNTLTTQSPEVAIAQKTLRQVVREVQAEGWVWNTEYEVEFSPDANDQVALSDAVLQIDINRYKHNDNYDVIRKGGYLYDRYTRSNKFADEDTIYADVVWMYAYEDMPQPFKDYCTSRATRIAHIRMVYDTKQADYNIFQNSRGRDPYNSYKPYQVIGR